MANSIHSFAKALNLTVKSADVQDMNPVIFATQFVPSLRGSDIVKDGDTVYRINTKANTSTEVSASTLTTEAKDGLVKGRGNDASVNAAISFGLVKKLVLKKNKAEPTTGCKTSVKDMADLLSLVVTDIKVAVQNEIIFQTQGIKQIAGLDIHDGQYFKLDTVSNTATLINAEAIAENAKADFLKGKVTDLTKFCENYSLISSLTLEVKPTAAA